MRRHSPVQAALIVALGLLLWELHRLDRAVGDYRRSVADHAAAVEGYRSVAETFNERLRTIADDLRGGPPR